MNWDGWLVMTVSVGGTTGFLVWCIYKVVLHSKSSTSTQKPTDTDLPD